MTTISHTLVFCMLDRKREVWGRIDPAGPRNGIPLSVPWALEKGKCGKAAMVLDYLGIGELLRQTLHQLLHVCRKLCDVVK